MYLLAWLKSPKPAKGVGLAPAPLRSADYEFVQITSAEAFPALKKTCIDEASASSKVTLNDWIIERAFDLTRGTRRQLGITSVPHLLV